MFVNEVKHYCNIVCNLIVALANCTLLTRLPESWILHLMQLCPLHSKTFIDDSEHCFNVVCPIVDSLNEVIIGLKLPLSLLACESQKQPTAKREDDELLICEPVKLGEHRKVFLALFASLTCLRDSSPEIFGFQKQTQLSPSTYAFGQTWIHL